jgi:5-formyltetrahydrofolate cyclo-ligase
MESLPNKEILRALLKQRRATLQATRREEAKEGLFTHLLSTIASVSFVLSFMNTPDEIDTSLINHYLACTGRLLLPKIEGMQLKIFHVFDLKNHLIPNAFGFYEPDPKQCPVISPTHIQIILVPALGFDSSNHRLGYGQGFYDRFLKQTPEAQTIGIGFKEQFVPSIPVQEHDIPLEKVSLF